MKSESNSPTTVEEYINNDKDAAANVQVAAEMAGLAVSFSENDVIYTYDIGTIEGVT